VAARLAALDAEVMQAMGEALPAPAPVTVQAARQDHPDPHDVREAERQVRGRLMVAASLLDGLAPAEGRCRRCARRSRSCRPSEATKKRAAAVSRGP
jgi:hypothetical protein